MSRHPFNNVKEKVGQFMAMVEDARPWYLGVRLGASNNKTVTRRYNLQADDAAAAATAAGTVLTLLAGVSAGAVVSYKIEHQYVNDAYATPTSDDAEYGEEAVISGKIDGSPLEGWSLNIPFPRITIFQATTGSGRDRVKMDSALVTNFAAAFNDGAQAYVSDGEFIGTLEEGRRK